MKPDVTLIITNWNGLDLLRECLPTVLEAVRFDRSHLYEVMVIDDCSTDNSLEILAKEFPEIRAEKTPENLGFQEANNYAVNLAESKIGDITPEQMTLENKVKIENKAFDEIINQLPEPIKSQYLEIWKEYQNNSSKESLFVHQIDRLEMALQAKIYQKSGKTMEDIEPFLESAKITSILRIAFS